MNVHLLTEKTVADHIKPMKIRGYGVKTPLSVLAKGEQMYAFGKPAGIVSNLKRKNADGSPHQFGKMGSFGEQVVDKKWVRTEVLGKLRRIYKMQTVGIAKENLDLSANIVLRNILLFKGYSFDRLLSLYTANGEQPLTFNVNTTLRLNHTDQYEDALGIKFTQIQVKKVFKNADGTTVIYFPEKLFQLTKKALATILEAIPAAVEAIA